MPPSSQPGLCVIAAGHCPQSTPTNQRAQKAFGAVFQRSGVGFWEIDFGQTYPTLDPSAVLMTLTLGDGSTSVRGYTYGVTLNGLLYSISLFRADTGAQADCTIDLKFELLPSQR